MPQADGLPPHIADQMPNGMFGGYPDDPTVAIADIIKYLKEEGDYRHLIHGIYDAVGFVLNLFVGDPNRVPLDMMMLSHAFGDLHAALLASPKTKSIPPVLLTILTQAVQAFLLWWQTRPIPTQLPAQ